MQNHHNFGLFYIDSNDQKYFYKSYKSLENLYYAIEFDEDFKKLKKKEVIVIQLEDTHENNY
jgi:hypothetical protein